MKQPAVNKTEGQGPTKVFISYSGADNPKLAEHLHTKLKRRPSIDVWWDAISILGGETWSEKIEEGIRWCDVVVFLVGARSIQKDSIAYEESTYARNLGTPIIPVFTDPTVGYKNLPRHLSKQSALDYSNYGIAKENAPSNRALFSSLLDAILKAATTGEVEERIERFVENLPDGGFGHLMREPVQFVGREWLFERLDNWVRNDTDQNLLIIGEPGAGKTEIVRKYDEIDRERADPRILGSYYCIHATSHSISADSQAKLFVQGLAKVFAKKQTFAQYDRFLNDDMDARNAINAANEYPIDALEHAILIPLTRLTRNIDSGSFCIIIDALDEAIETLGLNGDGIANSVFEVVCNLLYSPFRPPWLKLVITARPDNQVVNYFASSDIWNLSGAAWEQKGKDDMFLYVTRELNSSPVQAFFRKINFDTKDVATRFAAAAQRNFQYATFLLIELAKVIRSEEIDNENTVGLQYISELLNRLERDPHASKVYWLYTLSLNHRKSSIFYEKAWEALGVITGAFELLSWPQIQKVLNLNHKELNGIKNLLSVYIARREDGKVTLFHKSFSDYLTSSGDPSATGSQHRQLEKIDPKAGHLRLAMFCESELSSVRAQDYALRYAALHFLDAGDFSSAVFYVRQIEQDLADGVLDSRKDLEEELVQSLPKVKRRICERCPDEADFQKECIMWQGDDRWNKDKTLDTASLARMLDFYETSLFSKPIELIVTLNWEKFVNECFAILCSKDFVVRFVLAQILAKCSQLRFEKKRLANDIQAFVDSLEAEETEGLLQEIPFAFRWEIWAYFYAYRFAGPRSGEQGRTIEEFARLLVKRRNYIGRMILAELILHQLVKKGKGSDISGLVDIFVNDEPMWEYQRLDFGEMAAIGTLLQVRILSGKSDAGVDEQASSDADFCDLRDRLDQLRESLWLSRVPPLDVERERKLSHFLEFNSFLMAEAESFRNRLTCCVEKLDDDQLVDLFHVLFSHPSWSMREVFATELSSIAKGSSTDSTSYDKVKRVVERLSSSSNWRVVYGANESAFQLRGFEQGRLFKAAIERSASDAYANCKIRGNLIENALAIVLEQSLLRINEKWSEFKPFIKTTLTNEDDCWSLDILWEFFSEVNDWPDKKPEKAKVASEILETADLAESPFLGVVDDENGRKEWYKLDRFDFLMHIERVKASLVAKSGSEGSR